MEIYISTYNDDHFLKILLFFKNINLNQIHYRKLQIFTMLTNTFIDITYFQTLTNLKNILNFSHLILLFS